MWNSLSNINFYESLLERKNKENEKMSENDVNIARLCRTCLREAADTDNLLKDFEIGAMNINLDGKVLKMIDMFRESTGLKVEESDPLPHQICNNCIQNVSGAYFFRMQSHKAEKTLLKLVEALSDDLEENYENIQHLEENSCDVKQSGSSDEEENCELMEIEFDSVRYKIEADRDSAEIITDTITTNEDIYEEQECSEIQIEYIDKTDDEEVRGPSDFVAEIRKEVRQKPPKSLLNCPACSETFELKKDLHEHIKKSHPSTKAFECNTCQSRFSKLQTLKRHLKIHQDDQKNKLCTFCGKRFSRADDLKRHTRTHTNERPYACSLCPKRYKQISELKEHSLTHSREKVYNCEVCGKCLLTRNGYYVHMKVHAGIKKHKCNHCEKKFVTSGELSSHVRHIHDKERPFACIFENCERKFATKLSLEIHTRSHTGERPFGCHICGKKLATNSSLSDHLRIHTRELRFSCKVCKKTFNNSSSLKKHIPRHKIDQVSNKGSLNELNENIKLEENFGKLGTDNVKLEVSEVKAPSDVKQKSKGECQFLIQYNDTEVVQVAVTEEDGVHEYLES